MNGQAAKEMGKKIRLQENIKKEVSKKLNHPYYPPTLLAIAKSMGRIIFFAWPVLIFISQVVLGTLKGVADGLDNGLSEALRAYRRLKC